MTTQTEITQKNYHRAVRFFWGLLIGATPLKRAASRANGTRFGRPRKVDDADHIATAKRMKAGGHTGKDIAKYLGVSRATLYRYLGAETAG
jgi:DNA invertase Pin-like site-specific DNA recombinase